MSFSPDFSTSLGLDDFRALAAQAPAQPWSKLSVRADKVTTVPVWRSLGDDWLTPVQALYAVRDREGAFLLESIAPEARQGRYSLVGLECDRLVRGVGTRFETRRAGERAWQPREGCDPWEALRAEVARWVVPEITTPAPFWGGAVGYVSYDVITRFEPKVAPPLAEGDGFEFSFALGGVYAVFDRRMGRVWLLTLASVDGVGLEDAFAAATERLKAMEVELRAAPGPQAAELGVQRRSISPSSNFSRDAYLAAVERLRGHIRAGDIFQAVLSQRLSVPAEGVELAEVYRYLRQLNPSPYLFFMAFEELGLAGASPETLVRVRDRQVAVKPIAGTRPRGKDTQEDDALAAEMLADPKERAEHVMLVDLGRNDVGRIAEVGSVTLPQLMEVERYSHVMHIVSEVEGRLRPELDAWDALRASFPAGTLSGAPKVRAMQLLHEIEGLRRGIYGGAVGYVDFAGDADFAIAIRTVAQVGDTLRVQAGAGIVEASDPASEYEETLNKARAPLTAIEAALSAPR